MIASTFWKKTIHGAIWCDQSTLLRLLLVLAEVAGGVEELLRDDRRAGACASASATRSPVSSAPPRSNHARIVGTSSTTISSPSTVADPPSSNVTSFIALPQHSFPDSDLVVGVGDQHGRANWIVRAWIRRVAREVMHTASFW